MKNNLKVLRKNKGYTQIAVQMKTGIEQALLSKFENEERVPPTETLIRLADFYNVSLDYLVGRSKTKENYVLVPEDLFVKLTSVIKEIDSSVKIKK